MATAFKTYLDFVKISEDHVQFRNNLKLNRIAKKDINKVKIKLGDGTIMRRRHLYSKYKYRSADVFIKTDLGKFRVFEFSVDRKFSNDVDALTKWIKAQILLD